MPELNGPRRIQQLEDLAETGSPFYLLTDDGATRLSSDGFAWTEEYNIRYEMGNGQAVSPHEIIPTVNAKMMVAGTDFHYASNMGEILGLFSSPINVSPNCTGSPKPQIRKNTCSARITASAVATIRLTVLLSIFKT